MPLKRLYLPIVTAQIPLFVLAAHATGWALFASALLFMVFVFGAIPFIDAMIVQYVDDRLRSRVAGMRLAVSFGVSSVAVWVLGPAVKAAGFTTLLLAMAAHLGGDRAVRRLLAGAPGGTGAGDGADQGHRRSVTRLPAHARVQGRHDEPGSSPSTISTPSPPTCRGASESTRRSAAEHSRGVTLRI